MEKFKFLDISTADVAFEAYGKTLDELFANSALAMFEVMVDTSKVEKRMEKKINVEGEDLESLMFNWLNELLYWYGAEGLVFSHFDVKVYRENFKLEAKVFGEKIDPERHEVKTEVKAATYHKLKVWNEDGIWKARVILDI